MQGSGDGLFLPYCNSIRQGSRFFTREVMVGNTGIGGNNPIRLQSMTTTDTMDTLGTVEQTLRMVEAGCEIVRITAPSMKEAENLANIKKELKLRGSDVPLVADIHFTPNAAEAAARIVEKVRINPGNYADKKKFEQIDYTDVGYDAELERIRIKLLPLIKICKEYGTAMRIGTNHGSLSDRIMSRYGDTPEGMVESAMEFLHICEAENYRQLVISMKASNTQIMVQAYRLLNARMIAAGMNYPLHLGVTEAGDGEDGRIKSAVGIGALLEDGLGDTIRVSLTEEPEEEIPVAAALARRYELRHQPGKAVIDTPAQTSFSPFSYNRRVTLKTGLTGGGQAPVVVAEFSGSRGEDAAELAAAGYRYNLMLDKYEFTDQACDYIFYGDTIPGYSLPGGVRVILNSGAYNALLENTGAGGMENYSALYTGAEYLSITAAAKLKAHFVLANLDEDYSETIAGLGTNACLVAKTSNEDITHRLRALREEMEGHGKANPVIIQHSYNSTFDACMLHAATDCGTALLDGFGDGVWLTHNGRTTRETNMLAFGILQACRVRISKTEYISCPSCGRTLFNLQQTTQAIRERTNHLKGIKIGIMGCIVNGPGEMADADYGYVGAGEDRITLYRGKEVIKRNVNTAGAIDELINLIKEDGRWVNA